MRYGVQIGDDGRWKDFTDLREAQAHAVRLSSGEFGMAQLCDFEKGEWTYYRHGAVSGRYS